MSRHPSRLAAAQLTALFGVAALAMGCGKKGPPLAPLIVLPSAVREPAVQHFDDRVYIEFNVPATNTDQSVPADLERVELYALTTRPDPQRPPLALEDWLEFATLIATIPVRPPAPPPPPPDETASVVEPPPPDPAWPPRQGETVAIVEPLTSVVLTPVDVRLNDEDKEEDEEDDELDEFGPIVAPLVSPPMIDPPERTYVLVGVSPRGRESGPSPRASVPVVSSPARPSRPSVSYDADVVTLAWSAPPTAIVPGQPGATIAPPPAAPAPPPIAVPLVPPAPGAPLATVSFLPWPEPSRYEVFDVTPLEADRDVTVVPVPLNPAPLSVPAHAVVGVPFGGEHCYAVRMVDVVGSTEIRGPASLTTCMAFVDTFPPTPPAGLRAIGDASVVSLVWDESPESDVAGYLVLRGLPAGETLQPLTLDPIPETTYRDEAVEAGQRYVYAVQAVDTASPANISEPSMSVVEAPR